MNAEGNVHVRITTCDGAYCAFAQFLEAMAIDVSGSREEEGCLRFDLLKARAKRNFR